MRWTRIAAVTAGLMMAGAVFGSVAGTVVLFAWLASIGELRSALKDPIPLVELVLFVGGGLGAVLGPLAAWVLMRHVPLWLAVGGTTLGTLASGGLTLLLTGNPISAMLFGIFGFGLSALLVRNYAPRDDRRLIGG